MCIRDRSYEEGLKYLDGYKRFRLGEENEKIIWSNEFLKSMPPILQSEYILKGFENILL